MPPKPARATQVRIRSTRAQSSPEAVEAFLKRQEARAKGTGPLASERSDVQTPSEAQERPKGLVERKGRALATGERRGARQLRRMTVYLEPELAQRLAIHSAGTGSTLSDIIGEALSKHLPRS